MYMEQKHKSTYLHPYYTMITVSCCPLHLSQLFSSTQNFQPCWRPGKCTEKTEIVPIVQKTIKFAHRKLWTNQSESQFSNQASLDFLWGFPIIKPVARADDVTAQNTTADGRRAAGPVATFSSFRTSAGRVMFDSSKCRTIQSLILI